MAMFIRALCEHASYEVIACPRAIDFLARIGAAGEYELVVCDVEWLDELSIHLIRELQQQQKCPPLVLIDAADEASSERVAMLQPATVINKPLEAMRNVALMHTLRAANQ